MCGMVGVICSGDVRSAIAPARADSRHSGLQRPDSSRAESSDTGAVFELPGSQNRARVVCRDREDPHMKLRALLSILG